MAPIFKHFAGTVAAVALAPVKLLAEVAAFLFIKPAVTHKSGLVLVTGCSRGLGRATALSLARAQYTVVAGVRTADDGNALLAEHPKLLRHYVILDVTNRAHIAAAVPAVQTISRDTALPLVGLVNNAAVFSIAPTELIPDATIDHILATNFKGPLQVIQAFLPLLRAAKGRIINVSSAGANLPVPCLSVFLASKAALDQASSALRTELLAQDLPVISVRPGTMNTVCTGKPLPTAPVREGATEEQVGLYRAAVEKLANPKMEGATEPEQVADQVVRHAMASRRPLPVYNAGCDGSFFALMAQIIPPAMFSKMVSSSMSKK